MRVEHTFDAVELSAIRNPRAAQTAGGMTRLTKEPDMNTVPVHTHLALVVSGGAS
jgi:hypothetical protein